MKITEHRITTNDGVTIALTCFLPDGAPVGAVLIPSAMGVSQGYYRKFATWLAARGYGVVTFDYRGIGLSAPESLRGFRADIFDWACKDTAAVLDFLTAEVPNVPVNLVGHSLAAQIVGLLPNKEKVQRVMSVAAGSGYWLHNSWPTRRAVWWLWFVVTPIAVALAGYFPGKSLRKVGNLPAGVMLQWRRWCLNREYVVGVEGPEVRRGYASLRAPVLAVSFTDDEMMSRRSVDVLHSFYTGAAVTHRRISPSELGARRVGHFGFFRSSFESTLWPMALAWISNGTVEPTAA